MESNDNLEKGYVFFSFCGMDGRAVGACVADFTLEKQEEIVASENPQFALELELRARGAFPDEPIKHTRSFPLGDEEAAQEVLTEHNMEVNRLYGNEHMVKNGAVIGQEKYCSDCGCLSDDSSFKDVTDEYR